MLPRELKTPTFTALNPKWAHFHRPQSRSTDAGLELVVAPVARQGRSVAFLITKSGIEGLTYEQSRRLPIPTRGVRCSLNETSQLDHLRAIALTLTPSAAFSHSTAASLLGLPTPTSELAHVTVPSKNLRGSRRAVAWHVANVSAIGVQGLPCTNPLRTWLDLGAVLELPELVAATDCLLRRGLVTWDQLEPPKRTRGAMRLRRAAFLADARSLSPRESIIRVHLHLAGLPRPELNFNVIVDRGWVACADLAWPQYRVIVEYDGKHHGSDRQRHQDALTRNELAACGWQIRVLTDQHFRNMDRTVQMIAATLMAQGWYGVEGGVGGPARR